MAVLSLPQALCSLPTFPSLCPHHAMEEDGQGTRPSSAHPQCEDQGEPGRGRLQASSGCMQAKQEAGTVGRPDNVLP